MSNKEIINFLRNLLIFNKAKNNNKRERSILVRSSMPRSKTNKRKNYLIKQKCNK